MTVQLRVFKAQAENLQRHTSLQRRTRRHTLWNAKEAAIVQWAIVNLKVENIKAYLQLITRWKKRFGVSIWVATNESQKAPSDYTDAAVAFHHEIALLRVRHDYVPLNMCNVDQTMVRVDNPASQINNILVKSTIQIFNTSRASRSFTAASCHRDRRARTLRIWSEQSNFNLKEQQELKIVLAASRILL